MKQELGRSIQKNLCVSVVAIVRKERKKRQLISTLFLYVPVFVSDLLVLGPMAVLTRTSDGEGHRVTDMREGETHAPACRLAEVGLLHAGDAVLP